MMERGLADFGRVDVTSVARDGTERHVHGYQAVRYGIPPGSAAGYLPGLNVLCPAGGYSTQSGQPLMKHLTVRITASGRRA